MRRLIAGCLILMLSVGVGAPAAAGAQMGAVKKAGQAVKDTGKAAGEATKDVGKATVDTTKKGAKGAKKTMTGKAHATCVDGTRQVGDTEAAAAAACAKHGGVAKR
jgi:hypothetical protein